MENVQIQNYYRCTENGQRKMLSDLLQAALTILTSEKPVVVNSDKIDLVIYIPLDPRAPQTLEELERNLPQYDVEDIEGNAVIYLTEEIINNKVTAWGDRRGDDGNEGGRNLKFGEDSGATGNITVQMIPETSKSKNVDVLNLVHELSSATHEGRMESALHITEKIKSKLEHQPPEIVFDSKGKNQFMELNDSLRKLEGDIQDFAKPSCLKSKQKTKVYTSIFDGLETVPVKDFNENCECTRTVCFDDFSKRKTKDNYCQSSLVNITTPKLLEQDSNGRNFIVSDLINTYHQKEPFNLKFGSKRKAFKCNYNESTWWNEMRDVFEETCNVLEDDLKDGKGSWNKRQDIYSQPATFKPKKMFDPYNDLQQNLFPPGGKCCYCNSWVPTGSNPYCLNICYKCLQMLQGTNFKIA